MGNNHLYINGCSFTKGHTLTEEQSWPFLLQNELILNEKYQNNSQNANSLGTIVKKTMIDLRNCPKNTLAVIGLTWPTRYSLLINDFFVNLGPSAYLDDKNYKLNRILPLFDNNLDGEDGDIIEKNRDKEQTIQKYCDFLTNLCKFDDNFIKNQLYEHFILLKALESYLLSNNIDYILIEFNNSLNLVDYINRNTSFFNHNKEKILNLPLDENFYIESHPSTQQCIDIKDEIIKKIKKLYPKYIKSNQLNLF